MRFTSRLRRFWVKESDRSVETDSALSRKGRHIEVVVVAHDEAEAITLTRGIRAGTAAIYDLIRAGPDAVRVAEGRLAVQETMALAELGNLTPELAAIQAEVEGYARGYGLDFYPTIFELIDADQLNAIAALGGFPTRYPALAIRHGVRAAQQGLHTTGCRRSTRW